MPRSAPRRLSTLAVYTALFALAPPLGLGLGVLNLTVVLLQRGSRARLFRRRLRAWASELGRATHSATAGSA
jgi:hypothetical protein